MITITRRRSAWKAMRVFWADVDPALIDEKMCRAYRATRRTANDATVRLELMLLSSALGAHWARTSRGFGSRLPASGRRAT